MRVVADTNVIVRFLVADDRAQHAAVVARAMEILRQGGEIVVPTLVFAETSWVLATSYARSTKEIAGALAALVQAPPFVAEDRPLLDTALRLASTGSAGIADYLLLAYARREHAALLTFDAKLLRETGVEKP